MAPRVTIRRLCSHHVVSNFDCGDELLNQVLQAYHRNADSGDEVLTFVAESGPDVVGFVSVRDLLVHGRTHPQSHRILYLAGVGVDRAWQGSDVAARLIQKVYEVKRARSQGRTKVYRAVVCWDFQNPEIIQYLKDHGFQRWPGTIFWWRLFRR